MSAKKTDLIDRYLNAVKFWLPGKQQKDILAELAEDLHSQIEERESALGHPLEEAELVALLKQRGSPMRVASGFIPQHRLINPAMLPLYRMVLKIVLLPVLAPLFAIVFIAPVFDSARPGPALLSFLGEAVRALFFVIGMVTTIFALLDRYHTKWVDNWDPRKLPRVPPAHQQMQWYNDFAGFALGMAAFVFWGVLMWHRSAFAFTPNFRIVMGTIWGQLYWVILGLTLARALVDLYCFVRRGWTRGQSWSRLALDVAGMLLAAVALRAGNWVDISVANVVPAEVVRLVSLVNSTVQISLICAVIIPVFDVVKQLRLLLRAKNGRSTPILTVS
jgi:hypothetical protein